MVDASSTVPKIKRFSITGLFGDLRHDIQFPAEPQNASEPALLILMGPNGCGKTTILNMIAGMLKLDFDVFRKMPFKRALLELTNGDKLVVEKTKR